MKRAATVRAGYRFSSEVFHGEEFGTSGPSATASMQIWKQLRVQGSAGRSGAIYYAINPFGGTTTRGAAVSESNAR